MEFSGIVLAFLSLTVGYLLGSVLFGWIITRLLINRDIRQMGNGNPGGMNIIEQVGFLAGAGASILDIFKVLIPLLIAYHSFHLANPFLFLITFGAIMGHMYPLYFNFRGGRGASIIIGSYIFFIPYTLVLVTVTLFMVSLLTKLLAKHLLYLKAFPVSATLVIIVTVFVTLFLDYPGAVKFEVLSLALIALLSRETRHSFVVAFSPVISRFKRKIFT